jgi:SET domain-containing protein
MNDSRRNPVSTETYSWVNPKLVLRETKDRGKGVFAAEPIEKGEIVYCQGGQVVPASAVQEMTQPHLCFYMELDFYLCPIEGHIGIDWYINHSCNPNLGVPEGSCLCLSHIAIRDIKVGEELTYDYTEDFAIAGEEPAQKARIQFECKCGAANCKKIIYQ